METREVLWGEKNKNQTEMGEEEKNHHINWGHK